MYKETIKTMTKFFISPPFGNYLNLDQTTSIKGSFTLLPRGGLIVRAIMTIRYSMIHGDWINKMGLRNPGIDYAIKKYRNTDHIISVAILKETDVQRLNQKIPSDMNLELNVSCPNVEKNDCEKKLIDERLKCFLNGEREWCIIKLSPYVKEENIDFYYKEGFRQFHCSNTVPIPEGGLSGKKIKKVNEFLIPAIKEKYPDVTIIGGGGIKTVKDIMDYQKMGADHYAFSTVFFCPLKAQRMYNQLDVIRKIINNT
jgi:dihydroorotate dehydrogenase